MKHLTLTFALSFLIAVVFASSNQATDPVANQSIFDLVNYQDIQEVTLELDLEKMLANRRSPDAFKGTFSFEDNHGEMRNWKTKVNIRGKFRRTTCTEMPPLKLNFKKGELAEAGLTLHDDFKLVTQCIEDETKAKQLLLKEFLAYKIYNELSDYSFRVQFLKINYKDLSTGKVKKQWGFIIEDTAQMRGRLAAEKFDGKFGITKDQYNYTHSKRVALFQYMIGNLDWDMYTKVHNVKVINKTNRLIPIPYDFDFSGLVSAPYARLSTNFNVKSIKDRFYLGNAEDLEDMDQTIKLFESKKEEIIDLVKNFKPLKKEERREILTYLNSFYKDIDDIKLPVLKENTNLTAK